MRTETHIDHLRLRNFRKFADIEIDFDPKLTVLVSENGGGKTAILDGIVVALRHFVDTLLGGKPGQGFDKATDIRRARRDASMALQFPVALTARGTFGGRQTRWERELASSEGKTSHSEKHVGDLTHRAKDLLYHLRDFTDHRTPEAPVFPAIAYYGTGRLFQQHKRTEGKKLAAENLGLLTSAYVDCLSRLSRVEQFKIWFERVVREAQNEMASGIPSPHRPQAVLLAVRQAVDVVLKPSRWSQIDFDFQTEEVVANHPDQGRMPIDLLSDGVRGLIALVTDLAHMAVRINPHLGSEACQKTPGIVLIDEIDLSLHPKWQQTVIVGLREAFPAIQFILTTHSPLVLSTVPHQCIRILQESGQVITPSQETEGYAGTFALSTVFSVDDTPPGLYADMLRELRQLLQQGKFATERSQQLEQELLAHFGPQHPAMLSLVSLRRLMEFKARQQAGSGAS